MKSITIIYLQQTIFLGHAVFQLFCNYNSWQGDVISQVESVTFFIVLMSQFPMSIILLLLLLFLSSGN